MGKKGRRNKKSNNRKEELQQRRQRQLDHVVANRDDTGNEKTTRLHIGDRIWYRRRGANLRKRCFVKTIERGENNGGEESKNYEIVPIELDPTTGNDLPSTIINDVDLANGTVTLDPFPIFLRFDVGDRVACYISEEGSYVPCIVSMLFPSVHEDRDGRSCAPCYLCTQEYHNPGKQQLVYSDVDEYIQRRPAHFRFGIGDEVLLSCKHVLGLPNGFHTDDLWIKATVSRVGVSRTDQYAAYGCTLLDRQGRIHKCGVRLDTDEYLAGAATSPRQRLFDAIEQQCSFEHISILINTYKLDVMSFSDVVLEKAIRFASYGMLLWFQKSGSVNMCDITDGRGNSALHQIIESQQAERFFFDAGSQSKGDRFNDTLNFYHMGTHSLGLWFELRNSHGRTFVEEIIESGNCRLLQAVISPSQRFLWLFIDRLLENVDSLEQEARKSGQSEIVRMLEEYRRFTALREIGQLITHGEMCHIYTVGMVEEQKLMERLESPATGSLLGSQEEVVTQLLSHIKKRQTLPIERTICRFAENGAFRTLKLLCEADEALLFISNISSSEPVDHGEFRQPELFTTVARDVPKLRNLVDAAAIGGSVRATFETLTTRRYGSILRNLSADDLQVDICTFLEDELNSRDDKLSTWYRFLEHKISLLSDNNCLEGRLKVLDYLVKEKGMAPPSPIDVVRWRSCGVLRWLVANSYLELAKPASKNVEFVQASKKLTFMVGTNNIPDDKSIGVFLCLITIEFDDLQSLLWLLDEQAIALEKVKIQNWNVAHLCAMFGRLEIAMTLHNRGGAWRTLVSEPCGRQACEEGRLHAVHLAIENGYVEVADLLLSSGCPAVDSSGRSLELYTKRSSHDFVKEWGTAKLKPIELASNISKLYGLLSNTAGDDDCALQRHVKETECLSPLTWFDADIWEASESHQLGFSYLDVLTRCYHESSTNQFIWICIHCSEVNCCKPVRVGPRMTLGLFRAAPDSFRKQRALRVMELTLFADSRGDVGMGQWLSKPWARTICCDEPTDHDPILQAVKEMDREGSISVKLRDQLLYRRALKQIEEAANKAIRKQIMNNASFDTILDTANAFRDIRARGGELFSCENDILDDNGHLNLNYNCERVDIKKNLLGNHVLWLQNKPIGKLNRLYLFLAVEGYHEVILWALEHAVWTEKMELEFTRIAAWRGHLEIVRVCTGSDALTVNFKSTLRDRLQAAILGAVDGARLGDLKLYVLHEALTDQLRDPLVDKGLQGRIEKDMFLDEKALGGQQRYSAVPLLRNSLSGAAVHSYLTGTSSEDEKQGLMVWLVGNTSCSGRSLFEAVSLFSEILCREELYERTIDLVDYLLNNFELDIWKCFEAIEKLSGTFLAMRYLDKLDEANAVKDGIRWIERLCTLGLDVQSLNIDHSGRLSEDLSRFKDALNVSKGEQRRRTIAFELIKRGAATAAVIRSIESGSTDLLFRDKGGMTLCHLAAAYDQPVVLQLLVEKKSMSLDETDGRGRTVLDVAEGSGATGCVRWINEREAKMTISNFLSNNFRRYLAVQRWKNLKSGTCLIQAVWRMSLVWKRYRGLLLRRLGEKAQFEATWGAILNKFKEKISVSRDVMDSSWSTMKANMLDMRVHRSILENEQELSKTAAMLNEATLVALGDDKHEVADEDSAERVAVDMKGPRKDRLTDNLDTVVEYDKIRMTAEVVKWLRVGDPKYIGVF